jgi:hypothetical protein
VPEDIVDELEARGDNTQSGHVYTPRKILDCDMSR